MPKGVYPRIKPVTDETRKKLSLIRKGRIFSETHRKNLSIALKGKNKGHFSEETMNKMSIAQKARRDREGRKIHKRYIHQISTKPYQKWRTSVFERDNYTCQRCNKSKCYLQAHHIKHWALYVELRYEITNGLTLCRDCHKQEHKIRK